MEVETMTTDSVYRRRQDHMPEDGAHAAPGAA
jgi:hypothetical protein